MIRRWTALGVITAEEKFRRIKGYREMNSVPHPFEANKIPLLLRILREYVHNEPPVPTKFNRARDILLIGHDQCYAQ